MKYLRFSPTGCKDIGISKFEFVAKTQLLFILGASLPLLRVVPLYRTVIRFIKHQKVFFLSKREIKAVLHSKYKTKKRITLHNQILLNLLYLQPDVVNLCYCKTMTSSRINMQSFTTSILEFEASNQVFLTEISRKVDRVFFKKFLNAIFKKTETLESNSFQ